MFKRFVVLKDTHTHTSLDNTLLKSHICAGGGVAVCHQWCHANYYLIECSKN